MMLFRLIILYFLSDLIQCNCFSAHQPLTTSIERQVCLIAESEDGDIRNSQAKAIASSLSIPVVTELSSDNIGFYTHALRLVPYELDNITTFALGIESLTMEQKARRKTRQPKKQKSNPFYIDFCPPKNSRMGKRGSRESGTDKLVQAVSPKTMTKDFSVLDLTAGFGQDSLILALNGASNVCMVERDPIVYALLDDAIRRMNLLSSENNEVAKFLSARLSLRPGDSTKFLKSEINQLQEQPDICYLDPMFPPRTKSAAVKKGMQILHGLLDTQQKDEDCVKNRLREEEQLLEAALESAKSRVVVKRPIKARPLGEKQRPSYKVESSVNRWDVYIIH